MDWMTGIQRAIDYVESHLDETVDYGAVAREAASSPFHFQRMFAMVCGYTLGDYIRMRRLSVAADELYRTDAMDIDSDIRVMEAMLRRDTASVADDFGLNGSSAVQQRDE